jgi:hypothetical protein
MLGLMTRPDPNPLESSLLPRSKLVAGDRKYSWALRLIPTVIFGLLGCSSLSMGCVLAISLARSLLEGHQPAWSWYVSMIIFIWTGIAWIMASWLYLHKHRHWGTLAAAAGFALPMGWEVLTRMWPR